MRYIEHPDNDLNPDGFQRLGRSMRLYGKSDPPPPPDYRAAAQETAQGNLEAARQATTANRPTQITPWGRIDWTQNPTNRYDYDAYNQAMQSYNQATSGQGQIRQNPQGFSEIFDAATQAFRPATTQEVASRSNLVAPNLENFKIYDPDSGWTSTETLTPEAQNALNQQLALNTKFGEVANIGFDRARSIFENPELDVSGLPQRAIDVGQTAQQAILSRLNPQLSQQEDALRTRLANQGITLGSEAYNREMALQSQRANDLQMQAALQGINLDQANRSAALQEQAYMQDRPLNLINALRSGNQVQAPQFQQFAQQATTAGPDLLGATQAQYNAQVEAANARNAQTSGMMSGLFGIGMGLAGLPGAGGSIIQGAKGLFR